MNTDTFAMQPTRKRERANVERASHSLQCETCVDFKLDSGLFLNFGFPDLHEHPWPGIYEDSDRSKHWDHTLRTDDGYSIVCSKADLISFSDAFECMLSNTNAFLESCTNKTDLHETSGGDLKVLLSLYYLREKVRRTPFKVAIWYFK